MNTKKNKIIKLSFLVFTTIFLLLIFVDKSNQENILNFFTSPKQGTLKLKKDRTISIDSVKDAASYSEGTVVHQEDKIVKYNNKGEKDWEKDIVLKNYGVSFGKLNIYIYEKSTGYIQYLNLSGDIVREVNINRPINSIKVDFESLIIHASGAEGETIYIVDREGNQRQQEFEKGIDILNYSNSKDNNIYALANLYLEGEDIKSKLSAYKKNNEILYEKEFKDEMILYTQFIDTHRLVVMTNKKVYLLNDFEGNTLWSRPYSMIKSIDVENDKIAVLFSNSLEIISANGSIDEKYSFTEEYDNLIKLDELSIVVGKDYIKGLKNGDEVFNKSFKSEIKKLVKSKDKLIVILADKIELHSLNR